MPTIGRISSLLVPAVALAFATSSVSGCHRESVDDYLAAGDSAMQANKLPDAEHQYSEAAKTAPNDPRVHVALNCMARGCPRLPQEPFEADKLDAQLDRQAKEFYNEKRNVDPQPDKQTVRLSQILQFYTEDFTKKAPSLIAYVNKYRDDKIPAGWKVDFIPYDWILNAQ